MARVETVEIKWEADISDLIDKLAKEKGLNKAQTKAILGEIRKREDGRKKAAKITARAAEKSSTAAVRAAKQATKDKIEAFKKFGESAQGSVGAVTGRVFALGEGIAKFAGAAGPVGIAALAIAAMALAAVVGFAVIAGAVVAATMKVHRFILAARATKKELDPLYAMGALTPLAPGASEAIDTYAYAWQGVANVISDLGVSIAGNLAISLKEVAFEVLVLSIHVSNLVKDWLEGNSIIKRAIIHSLMNPMMEVTKVLRSMLVALWPIIEASDRLRGVSGSFSAMQDAITGAEAAMAKLLSPKVDAAFVSLMDGAQGLGGGFADAREQAQIMVDELAKVSAANSRTTKTTKALKAATDEYSKALAGLVARIAGVSGATEGLSAAFAGFRDAAALELASPAAKIEMQLARDLDAFAVARDALEAHTQKLQSSIVAARGQGMPTDELKTQLDESLELLAGYERGREAIHQAASDKVMEIASKEQDAREKMTQATITSVIGAGTAIGQFSAVLAKNAEDGTKAQKRAAIATFAIQQATAIATITVATAQAIVNALATPMVPLNFIMAAATGVAGAAQLATVMATPAPSFHIGGAIGGSRMAPDEVSIRAKSGEGVLTSRGMASIGGAQGLSGLNRGASGAPELIVIQKYQHRAFGAFTQDNVRMVNSPIRKAIKGNRKVGHAG